MVDSDKNDDGNGEDQVDSDDNVDEPACDFDTEWHELQDIVNLTEEKFRTFWKDEHFQKAFKKNKPSEKTTPVCICNLLILMCFFSLFLFR